MQGSPDWIIYRNTKNHHIWRYMVSFEWQNIEFFMEFQLENLITLNIIWFKLKLNIEQARDKFSKCLLTGCFKHNQWVFLRHYCAWCVGPLLMNQEEYHSLILELEIFNWLERYVWPSRQKEYQMSLLVLQLINEKKLCWHSLIQISLSLKMIYSRYIYVNGCLSEGRDFGLWSCASDLGLKFLEKN